MPLSKHRIRSTRQILQQHVPHVFRFAMRLTQNTHDADDLAQEVMLRAWRNAGQLRQPDAARVWLFRITVNVWRDTLRRRSRSPDVEAIEKNEPVDRGQAPPTLALQNEQLQRTMSALDELPERQKEVVYLHICEGFRLREIADVLEITYEAAKASLAMGRKRMREKLRDVFSEIDHAASNR